MVLLSLQDVQHKKYIPFDTDETDSDIEPPEGVLRMNARSSVERSMNAALSSLTSVDGNKYAVKYSAEFGLVGVEEEEALRRLMSNDDRLYEQQTLPTGTVDGQEFYNDLYKAAFQSLRDKVLTRRRKNMETLIESYTTEKRVLEEARAAFKSEVAGMETNWEKQRIEVDNRKAKLDKRQAEIDGKVDMANEKIRKGIEAAAMKKDAETQAAKLIGDAEAQSADMLRKATIEAASVKEKGRVAGAEAIHNGNLRAIEVQTLTTTHAQKKQEEILVKANEDAKVIRDEANADANRIREQATADANRIRDQATEAAAAIRAEASAFLASLKKGPDEADEATDDQAQAVKGSEKKARGSKAK